MFVMENRMILDELDDMKAKMALLKEKLDKQKIVNETHLRNAIKGNISKLNRNAVRKMLLSAIAAVYCTYINCIYGFSLYFTAFTVVMLLFCTIATYMYHKALMRNRNLSLDLMKETFDLLKLKRRYKSWVWIAVPLVIVWVSLFSYEALFLIPDKAMYMSFISGILAGVVIGGIIGTRIHMKTLRRIETLLEQIEELKNGM